MRRRAAATAAAAAAAFAVAACDDTAVRVELVFDLPVPEDPTARPSGLQELVLAVARGDSTAPPTSQNFPPGARVELDAVPFGDDLVVRLTGLRSGGLAAYGRTCPFSVSADAAPPSPHLWFAIAPTFGTPALSPVSRIGGAAIELAGSAIVVGGGVGAVERFDPRTGELAELGQVVPRTGAAAALFGTQLAVVGGALGGVPAGILELIQPTGDGARIDRIDDARAARIGATATALTDGRVIIIGGRDATGVPTGDLVVLSTPPGSGPELRALGRMLAHPRTEHTATRLGDDVGAPVLIAGGAGPAGLVAIAELWKPLSGELARPATFAPSMIVPRRGHRAELLPDGSVLFLGGVDAAGQPIRTLERFVIDAGFVPAGVLPPTIGLVEMTTTRLPDGRIFIAGGRPLPGGPAVAEAVIARLDSTNDTVDVVPTLDDLAVPRAGHHAVLLCDDTIWIGGGAAAPPEAERYTAPPPLERR